MARALTSGGGREGGRMGGIRRLVVGRVGRRGRRVGGWQGVIGT